MKRYLISSIVTLVLGLVIYYFRLPAINIQSIGFWTYLIILAGIFLITSVLDIEATFVRTLKRIKGAQICVIIIALSLLSIGLVNLVLSPVFNSKSYKERIIVNENGDFNSDIKPVDFNHIPLLDKDSSSKLGDRVMGRMPELVSQFYVSDLYTVINYNNDIVRVTPLEYNGFFKYLSNHKEGIKGYIAVNSTTGEANLVKLDKGMKYMPSAILNEDLDRHLRFSYPTYIFGEKSFEIDNEGKPYWIVQVMSFSGVGLKRDVKGLIIVDAITGNSNYYKKDDVPTWVDHVYSADLIMEQVDDWGLYNKGFLNSIFGQKGVVATTTGYNYLVQDDDVYMYTGITSVSSDEANIGFILTNLRTKETVYYSVPGATEYSAMASSEGQVQQMNYDATFPLLINLNNHPTYLLSLKDAAGLVKMYAFVDVADYQKVAILESSRGIDAAKDNYINTVNFENNEVNELLEKSITVKSISNAIIDNNTYYFIEDKDNKKYSISIKMNKKLLPFLKVGDNIDIKYYESDVSEIESLTLK